MAMGKHKKKEERANEHDCDFCDESFPSRDLLVDHFAAIHHEENIINTIEMCDRIMEDMNVKTEKNEEDDGDEEIQEEPMEVEYVSVQKKNTLIPKFKLIFKEVRI